MRSLFQKIREVNRPYCTALVAAAGSSTRMGGVDKLMEFLDGVPVLMRTLTALQQADSVDEIIIATRETALVDLIVLNNSQSDNEIYGRAIVEFKRDPETGEKSDQTIAIEYGNGKTTKAINSGNAVSTGTFVAVRLNKAGTMFTSFDTMSKLGNVSAGAWVGKTAVNYGGRTYEVASDVQCYNLDTGRWMNDLDTAKNYGGTMNLYVYDGVIRIVEVRG